MATTETTAAIATDDPQIPLDTTRSIGITRRYTRPGVDPYDEIEWEVRDAIIPGKDGPAFEQREVEFPVFWSATATNIVAQKYFRGPLGTPQRERSVRQMISRVVDTITAWGRKDGYFADDDEADAFHAELKHLLVNQYAAFNSPVWFNVGFEERPQCSRLLHPRHRRLDGLDPQLDRRGGADLPRRLGLGHQPLARALLEGAALQGRLSPRGRSRSCAAPMPRPARSSRAARRAARPRWSCSTSITPTSRSSSGASRARRRRRARSRRPATTCRWTRRTGPRSSTRTRTTRCA